MPARRTSTTNPARRWTDAQLLALKPMLAQIELEPFDSPDHLFELKWDGVRHLVMRLRDRLAMMTRNNIDAVARYPELAVLADLPPGTVIDGEVVMLVKGRPSFQALMKRAQLKRTVDINRTMRTSPVIFVAFDVLFAGGRSVMTQNVLQRKEHLQELVAALKSRSVIVSDHVIEHGKAVFDEAVRLQFEGVMAKRINSRYEAGRRSADWLKIKPKKSQTFEIIGYIADEPTREARALLIAETIDGKRIYRGKVGTGFTQADRLGLYKKLKTKPKLSNPPNGGPRDAQWRNTGLSCRVKYFEHTAEGKLRAPVYHGLV